MTLQEMDLVAGETIQIGNHLITVLDVEGEQVIFRIHNLATGEFLQDSDLPPMQPR